MPSMTEVSHDRSLPQGEVPEGAKNMGKSIMLTAINRVRERRRRIDPESDHELGVRVNMPAINGHSILIDERLDDLHVGRDQDGNFLVRLKDSAREEIIEHPLRDGVAVSVAGIGLLGAGLYMRSKRKK